MTIPQPAGIGPLPVSTRQQIIENAQGLGFRRVGFAQVTHPPPGSAEFRRFINEGRHGDMAWLPRNEAARHDLDLILPGAQSVIILGTDYQHPRPPDPGGLTGMVSCYAWGRDYHNLVGKRARKLTRKLQQNHPEHCWTWSLDTRPVVERAWAATGGLGFIGKNCCIILPATSSYLFLALVFTTMALEPDPPMGDHCGRCQRCLDACPTDAFTGPRMLDARRCIAYHTIENRGSIPEDLRAGLGRWVFGCDDCQTVCPHNSTPTSIEEDLKPRPGHAWLDLEWLLTTPDETIDQHFLGSPIRRAKPEGLKRNACIVLGNLRDPAGRAPLLEAQRHQSAMVREHAQWALDQL